MSGPLASTQLPYFNPRSLPGCVLWLDGADSSSMALTGSVITTWRDKSGQGNNATAFNSPTLSGSNVTMNGTNQYFTCPNVSYRPCNIFCVATYTGSGEGQLIRKGQTSGVSYEFGMAVLTTTTVRYEIRTSGGGSININPTVASTSGIQLYELTYDNTTGTAFFNATSVGSGTATGPVFTGSTPLFLGATPSDGGGVAGFYFTGSFQEFIIYTTPPSTLQRQQVEGYLAWKWGLRSKLPDGHPFKNVPVYPNPPVPFSPVVPNTTFSLTGYPLSIPGCQVWLDAADRNSFVLSGSSITTWRDKSGNRFNAVGGSAGTGTYSATGFNSLPTVQITATGNMRAPAPAGTFPSSFCLFVMFQKTGGNTGVFDTVVTRTNTFYPAPLDCYSGDSGNTSILTGSQSGIGSITLSGNQLFRTPTPTMLFIGILSASSLGVSINGTYTAYTPSGGVYQDTATNVYIGYRENNDIKMNGNISEIICYSNPLTVTQVQQVEGYLAWKWGLTGNLPNGHPYKTPPLAPFSYGVRRAVNATWSPLSFSGTVLWLDAKDSSTIVSSGTSVTRWNDKSPLAMFATPSNANVSLSSSSNFTGLFINNNNNANAPGTTLLSLNSNFMTTSNYTIFATFQFTSSALNQTIFSNTRTTGDARIQLGETQSFDVLADGTTLRAMTFTLGTSRQQICATTSSNGIFFFQNGTIIGSNTTTGAVYTTDAGGLPSIGGPSQSPPDNRFMTGWMFEMIIYSSVLSLQQRQQVEGYLAWKWGIQGSLPAGHPFRNIPPTP